MKLGPLRRYKKLLDLLGFIFQYFPSLSDLFMFSYFLIFIAICMLLRGCSKRLSPHVTISHYFKVPPSPSMSTGNILVSWFFPKDFHLLSSPPPPHPPTHSPICEKRGINQPPPFIVNTSPFQIITTILKFPPYIYDNALPAY